MHHHKLLVFTHIGRLQGCGLNFDGLGDCGTVGCFCKTVEGFHLSVFLRDKKRQLSVDKS